MRFFLWLPLVLSYDMPCFHCKYLKIDGKCARIRLKDDFYYSYFYLYLLPYLHPNE